MAPEAPSGEESWSWQPAVWPAEPTASSSVIKRASAGVSVELLDSLASKTEPNKLTNDPVLYFECHPTLLRPTLSRIPLHVR